MKVADRPLLGRRRLFNISAGFFGIQAAFALQNANVSRIFQTLGASVDALPILWIAGPVTGLVVQPIVGHYSDRTWTRLGRRRPYFLGGALLCALALLLMPNARALWAAALLLWLMDASVNVSMEPFRAFVGDMLAPAQRTAGYAWQTILIGAGSVAASLAPAVLTGLGVANVAPSGLIPPSVRIAFYLGAAALLLAVGWTVLSTREPPPDEIGAVSALFEPPPAAPSARYAPVWLAAGVCAILLVREFGADRQLYLLGAMLILFGAALVWNAVRVRGGARSRLLNHVLADLAAMPAMMRRLALVQALSWFGLFILFIYATPVVALVQGGATDPASAAYNAAANWWGVMAATYNGVAALYAFALPALGRQLGTPRLHLVNLVAGAAGFVGIATIASPLVALLACIGIGMAWASILTIPYALLCDALPPGKLGIYMGLFNLFIVLPQLMVSAIMGPVAHALFPQAPQGCFLIAAICLLGAGLATLRIRPAAALSLTR